MGGDVLCTPSPLPSNTGVSLSPTRMIAQPYNRSVFVSWSLYLPCNGNQALSSLMPGLRKW